MIEGVLILFAGYLIGAGSMWWYKTTKAELEPKSKPFDDYRDPITGRLKRPKKG